MSAKIDIINGAYSQLRISGMTVDPSPEDVEVALSRLENMMAEIEEDNIRIGYVFEEEPDPNTRHGVRRAFWHMMETNLAIRVAPDFNKVVHPALAAQASQSMSQASSITAADRVKEVQYPRRQPRGAGNTLRYNRWFRYQRAQQNAPTDSNIMITGDVRDYAEDFSNLLAAGETITAQEINVDTGLTLVSTLIDGGVVRYRLRADSGSELRTYRQIEIKATTSAGEIKTRVVNFEVRDPDRTGVN